jgi:hypothetical protein
LAPTVVPLQSCDRRGCTPTRTVTVAGTFTSTGPLQSFSDRSKYTDGACTYTFSGKGAGREARGTITVDGQALSAQAFLTSSTSTFKVSCA